MGEELTVHRETAKHRPCQEYPVSGKRFAPNFFRPSGLSRRRLRLFTVKSGRRQSSRLTLKRRGLRLRTLPRGGQSAINPFQ